MSDNVNSMDIFEEKYDFEVKYMDVSKLRYFEDNPRIGSIVHKKKFKDDGKKQKFIHGELKKGTSVTNLLDRIEKHGGLIEEIIVRGDTNEVIEGNSRLAVYRILAKKHRNNADWKKIKCKVIKNFNDSAQRTFLSELHQRGKTPWRKYEKAYWVNRLIKDEKLPKEKVSDDIGITEREIDKLLLAIEIMENNNDDERKNFSYYDVIVRKLSIQNEFINNEDFRELICEEIKKKEKSTRFTAINFRDSMPYIIKEERVYNKFLSKEINFYDAMKLAQADAIHETIDAAAELLETIDEKKINDMDRGKSSLVKGSIENLKEEVNRVDALITEKVD